MSKLLTALTLALLLSLVLVGAVGIGVAGATHSDGEGPNNDFVRGTMKISGTDPNNPSVTFEETFHVNATSGPGGEEPRGRFFIKSSASDPNSFRNLELRGRITCLNVEGNRAIYSGVIERGENFRGFNLAGFHIVAAAVDNGEPGDGDGFQFYSITSTPRTCEVAFRPFSIGEQGNYVVHDASETP